MYIITFNSNDLYFGWVAKQTRARRESRFNNFNLYRRIALRRLEKRVQNSRRMGFPVVAGWWKVRFEKHQPPSNVFKKEYHWQCDSIENFAAISLCPTGIDHSPWNFIRFFVHPYRPPQASRIKSLYVLASIFFSFVNSFVLTFKVSDP